MKNLLINMAFNRESAFAENNQASGQDSGVLINLAKYGAFGAALSFAFGKIAETVYPNASDILESMSTEEFAQLSRLKSNAIVLADYVHTSPTTTILAGALAGALLYMKNYGKKN